MAYLPRRDATCARQRRRLLAWPCAAWLAAALAPARAAGTRVRTQVVTTLGSFVIEVDTAVAPRTVANYLAHVDGRHLDGSAVYRIVTLGNQPDASRPRIEVVQWGLNLPDGGAPPFAPIAHETTRDTGLAHLDGTVSMARAEPGSAAGEFFICLGAQPALDFGGARNPDGQGFAAFGRVVEGMAVVRALHARGGAEQYLAEPIRVIAVRRIGPDKAP